MLQIPDEAAQHEHLCITVRLMVPNDFHLYNE